MSGRPHPAAAAIEMKLRQSTSSVFVPDGIPLADAMRRSTHLGIGAHPDDLEFMALHGILACHDSAAHWFAGVTCTDGAGSVRGGSCADATDEQMRVFRRDEQNRAATLGRYGVMLQLGYGSQSIKQTQSRELREDLRAILMTTRPEIVYTHNLADKHDTHVAIAWAVVRAIRELPRADRPKHLWGCEVWRGLDWMRESDKIHMDVTGHEVLKAALSEVFVTQISGGKRYDLATKGRRLANATFADPQSVDTSAEVIFGMDLTPLAQDDSLDPATYVDGYVERFRSDVATALRRQVGGSGP